VESYLAHVTATRRLVMVHKLGGTNEGERRRITSLLNALPTRSTTVIARLEDKLGKPVITSTQATLWHALRLAGIDDPITGYGRLLDG